MLFDQVTNGQMQAASVLSGAAMAAFLAARIFGNRAQAARIVVAGVYIAGVLAFTAHLLF